MQRRLHTWPQVVVRAILVIEYLRRKQPVVKMSVAARVVPVGRLREGGDVPDVVEGVVAEDAVRPAVGVLAA